MKKLISVLTLVGLSLMLGMALTVAISSDAQAEWCNVWDYHILAYGGECICGDNAHGIYITACRGYDEFYNHCACFTYCSACPPRHAKGPVPQETPPDGSDR